MAQNTIGTIFKVTTFGESHGAGLGCIVDGVPSGIKIDENRIQAALDRRKPGQSFGGKNNASVTARKEDDKAELLSGIFEGKSEGTPIGIVIRNTSQHSKDYGNLAYTFRPGHADFAFQSKYGFRDYRGGGRSSGRETAARVAAGAIALQVLENLCNIKIMAYTERAAGVSISKVDFAQIEQNALRAPDNEAAAKMNAKIEEIRANKDSAGGIIACRVSGLPAGLGEPVFGKLDAELARAILSVGAVKGIEFGAGFSAADSTGSKNNDKMRVDSEGKPVFETNNAGGILGGISNGNDIFFRVAVKPVPSIFQEQKTISVDEAGKYTDSDLVIEGRHDVCLCPRIVPVIEAMTAIVLADLMLQNRASRI
ncbi:chorismate synthase [uncultured Treponema sp.]|uniref:chorismate synthase n=1 Tax=uncultured Treponema sp. TaxID=162155 RepID=UPI0025DC49B1|nr:chorismate synthase [uncultured Treponema sp.]